MKSMTATVAPSTAQAPDVSSTFRRPPIGLLLINWLLPGVGFILVGRRSRGLMQLLLVVGTFILGLLLHGGVAWPAWSPKSPEFNLINNFTFLIQLGAGLPSLISLVADRLEFTLLGGIPQHPFYELGGYYMVVAGALNYFATCNFYDRFFVKNSRFAPQERPEEEPGGDS